MTAVDTGLRTVGPEGVEILSPDAAEDLWLATRRLGVGASEVAAVLGESRYDSPYSLWARKTGRSEPEPRSKVQKRGQRFESLIAEAFADDHPEYELAPVGLVQHNDNAWELATPDRLLLTNGQQAALLECKTAGFGKTAEWGEEGTDDIPLAYGLQVQWQLAVTRLPFAFVACQFSLDDRRDYLVRRDDDVIAFLRERVYAFWHEHVLADVAPVLDGHEATTKAMRALPTRESAALPAKALELRATYWAEKDVAAKHEAAAAAAANELRAMLAGAEIGLLGDTPLVTNKVQAGRTSFDLDRFRKDYPALAPEYVQRGADFPVLRISKPKGV